MLYGKTWQTELARTLHFSEESGNVRKLAKGTRNISNGVKEDTIKAMKKKVQDLADAVAFLENPEKLIVNTSEFNILSFDQFGVRQWDKFQGPEFSDYTILIDGELLKSQYEIEFISTVIAAAGEQAYKDGNNLALIEIIPQYFDLQFLSVDLKQQYIQKTKGVE